MTRRARTARFAALCLTVLALSPQGARSAEDGLYPKAPPPDSAFVRFADAAGPAPIVVGGRDFGKTHAHGAISPYAPLSPGAVDIRLGGAQIRGTLAPGGRYIAAAGPAGAALFQEPAFDPFLKGQIILLNLNPEGSAAIMAGDTPIIADVAPMSLRTQAVNPAAVALTVRLNGREVARLPARVTPRGDSRVIVVTKDGATDNDPAKPVP